MRICKLSIEGTSPYSQSRQHEEPKLEKETHDDYDRRTWRSKLTTDNNGVVVIPGIAIKQALDRAAQMLSLQVPGKGKATYTKSFVSGVSVFEDVALGIHRDNVASIRISANADGRRGSGKRVPRIFPVIPAPWAGEVDVYILDDTLPDQVFQQVAVAAGKLVGVGRFRPQNGGSNGRFKISKFEWRTEL